MDVQTMLKSGNLKRGLLGLIMLTALVGCETVPNNGSEENAKINKPTTPAPEPVKPAPTPEEIAVQQAQATAKQALTDGIAAYNAGDYNTAIKHLTSNDLAQADKAQQLDALKYTAFSYCLTRRQLLCKQSFEKAFKLDPNFDLQPGEKGHPLWGPVFERAKKGK